VQVRFEANLAIGPSSSNGKEKAKVKKKPTKSSIPPHVDRKTTKASKDPKKVDIFLIISTNHV
ncbi:hypothetical protein J1N35_014206, partial [Gossypium stocksii]